MCGSIAKNKHEINGRRELNRKQGNNFPKVKCYKENP